MNTEEAHRHFSATCFNAVWDLLDKEERTAAEEEKMIETAHASLYHWLNRDDVTDQNLSIAYWQLSRVYAVAGLGNEAVRYSDKCIRISENLAPFYRGYGFEAGARAASVSGDDDAAGRFLDQARECLAGVTDPEEKHLLESDLESLAT